MSVSKIIVYDYLDLYEILLELNDFFDLKIKAINNEKELKAFIEETNDYLIISSKQISNCKKQLIFDSFPIKISELMEKININILKNNYSLKSNIVIGKYKLNINSREITLGQKVLKLTEREVKMIIYLSNSKNPVTINELQSEIWSYAPDLETHTVETHIHRLRKKFYHLFQDDNFIKNTKKGYSFN